MKYRIKQTDKSTFIVQGNRLYLDGTIDTSIFLTLNIQGFAYHTFRCRRKFESNRTYRRLERKHHNEKAYFPSIEEATAFIKECKTDYPKYHKA